MVRPPSLPESIYSTVFLKSRHKHPIFDHCARRWSTGTSPETRFEWCGAMIVVAWGHADRAAPATWHVQCVMLLGWRKGSMVESARPQAVRSTH